jgi:hypothetical protein
MGNAGPSLTGVDRAGLARADDITMTTSYSRRQGDYRYDVEIYESASASEAGRFCARVVNMVRLQAGQIVSVNAELQEEYGATRHEAFSRMEAVVEVWARNQTQQS